MPIAPNHQKLIIANKNYKGVNDPYARDMRAIEMWANEGIVRKLIAGTNVTLTPSSGVDAGTGIEISATGGGGTTYASLTGPGETVTPGLLNQAGPFSVIDPSGGGHTAAGNAIELLDQTSAGYGIDIASTHGNSAVGGLSALLSSTSSLGTASVVAGGGGSAGIVASLHNNSVEALGSGQITINSANFQDVTVGSFGMFTTNTGNGSQIETSTSGLVGFMGATPIGRQFITGSRGGNAALAHLLAALASFGLIVDNTTP